MGRFHIAWCIFCLFGGSFGIPAALLYDYNIKEAVRLPKGDEVSSGPITLKVPIIFFGEAYDTIYVNNNGLLSFQTEIPNFLNLEFPLDYPAIAPFYSNVDTTNAGTVSYYETENPALLQRATENIHDQFLHHGDFQGTSLFIATWEAVGYHDKMSDKLNTYQVAIVTDGSNSFVEFLYPENGIQWIQGTGDESGLPDARAQAGFVSGEGSVFTLPASGTEQVESLEKWSNMDLLGQWSFKVDGDEIGEPDQNNDEKPNKLPGKTCAEAPTYCHVHGKCIDYERGFCCECDESFYGNGRFCVKKDSPLRVNGKITGTINGEKLGSIDLQSYIVMVDARAYTAISKIPESIGVDIQSLQILGSVIGYLFAKPIRGAINGYQLTGGVFNHTAQLFFHNTNQTIVISQKYHGLDVFDQLRLEAHIQGEIPNLPDNTKVIIDEYQEEYTVTSPGIVQLSSNRIFKYLDNSGAEIVHPYSVHQSFQFDECKYRNSTYGNTWKLKVGKNFISYEATEQIIRFGLSNKITPIGDFDPCEEGRSKCQENSVCVVENDSYRCACKPGFQYVRAENDSTVCGDTNECAIGIADCDYNAQCINLVGSYRCQCNPGFEGDGRVCQNSASCANVKCNENSECFESNGIAECRCSPGFTGNGQTCQPKIAQSCHIANNCSPYGVCQIDPATEEYHCLCQMGFEGDGYQCTQIIVTTTSTEAVPVTIPNTEQYIPSSSDTPSITLPSSTEGKSPIPTEATIQTTTDRVPQSCNTTACWCPEGFLLDQHTQYCVRPEDHTEMSTIPFDICDTCHTDAECLFVPENSSYSCICNEGFEGSGTECRELRVSCMVENNCDVHASCVYNATIGKSTCVCMSGYEGDGYTCTLAICTSNDDCSATEECLRTNAQLYECVCKEGYARDSQNLCVDNSSSCGGGTCVENAECLFDPSYSIQYCSCKAGYDGDGITECKLKPVGCDVLKNCGLHSVCLYDAQIDLHTCKCQDGFNGDGFVCQLVENCLTNPSLCHSDASCVANNNRQYNCVCNHGFIGNGTTCLRSPTHEGGFLLLNQGMATLKLPLGESKEKFGRAVQVKGSQTAVGLDIDCIDGKFFWSDITGRAIRTAYYNGSDKQDFITGDIGSPEGISVDWVSRNIYWTDSTKDTIDVASLDGKRRVTLINTDLVNPRGITVHPQRGKLFWSDWDRRRPKIEWANEDGSERAIFLEGDSVSLPNSLTIDFDTEELCFADAGTKKIECIQIDSRQKRTVATNCTYPFGITVNDRYIFWSDWITKRVERVDKRTLQRLPPLPLPLVATGSRLFQIVAVPLRCPNLQNICQFKDQCPPEHICLPNGHGSRTCTCTYKANSPLEKPTCILPSSQKQFTFF
ncbi:hypothetical protein WA026_015561 [Henosepilachna vigintioctopunctata]|uniref:Nidogen n=1 Tax=Henosepilachna vigintioctopunctata TaxID=420089 RepID=A0AAW1VG46_9CUCU